MPVLVRLRTLLKLWKWVQMRYGIDLSIEQIRQTPQRQLRDELIGYQERFLSDGKLTEDEPDYVRVQCADLPATVLVDHGISAPVIGQTANDANAAPGNAVDFCPDDA